MNGTFALSSLVGQVILMTRSVEQLNREHDNEAIEEDTVAAINSLLHCSRNAAISGYEQLLAEQKVRQPQEHETEQEKPETIPLTLF